LAFLDEQPNIIEGIEHIYVLTDRQLIEQIQESTHAINPAQWPAGYDLNEERILVSKETGRVWVLPNEQLRREILAAYHDGQIAGHLGMSGTLELVGHKYWWEEIVAFTKRYVEGCHICARNKVRNKKPGGLLQPLPIPEGPWLWTQSDFIIELPPSKGYDTIYVIADRLTKMAHFIPCKTTCTSKELAILHIQ
jgi:hypothetical protein